MKAFVLVRDSAQYARETVSGLNSAVMEADSFGHIRLTCGDVRQLLLRSFGFGFGDGWVFGESLEGLVGSGHNCDEQTDGC